MKKWSLFETGTPQSWKEHVGGRFNTKGKKFLDRDLALEFFGVSVNELAAGEHAPFWHAHSTLEELYLVIEGEGEFALDDDIVAVQPGSALRVGQGVMRSWRCLPTSETPMRWICIRGAGAKLADVPPDAKPVLYTEKPLPWG